MPRSKVNALDNQNTKSYKVEVDVETLEPMDLTGIDIGGTFTDLISYDMNDDTIKVGKVSSTPDDPSIGLVNGLDNIGVGAESIQRLVHGTTVATNATLERGGADVGLLTTEGFQDVLEIGWRDRPNLWGLEGEYEPLVPRDRSIGISERTSPDGKIIEPVSESEIREAGQELLESGAESVAISFLHSYANMENEKKAVEVIEDLWPNEYVVRSSEVLPEFREFERTSTTVLTSYTQPVISSYLSKLEDRLMERGFNNDILLMQSNGGVASSNVSKRRSAHTMLSGPAAGATAASHIAKLTGFENVISCDMGGTSFDVALLPGGDPVMTQSTDLDYQVPIRVPMADISTIGAGGGSIAWIDEGGILHTGPESAGADPGPVCYRKGGEDITITDANLVLHRINPDNPIGEDIAMDLDYTRNTLKSDISEELGLSLVDSANAILDVAINKMVGKVRELSINKGYDPREFALVTFGGAGPLHAGELIKKSDVPSAIVPYYPGILSAIGCIIADIRHDHVQTVNERIDDLNIDSFHETMEELKSEGESLVAVNKSDIETEVTYKSDMLYSGQTHTVTVPIPNTTPSRQKLKEQFRQVYLEKYTEPVERPILIDNIKVTVKAEREKNINLKQLIKTEGESLNDARKEYRDVYFDDDWYKTPIYQRDRLPLGAEFSGPAIVEQSDTTTVINPGLSAEIDEFGNIIMSTD